MASRKSATKIEDIIRQRLEDDKASQETGSLGRARKKSTVFKQTYFIPNTSINGVSFSHVKRTKSFRHLGLDDSPQTLEDIKELDFSDLTLIKAQLTKQGREHHPLSADVRPSLKRIIDTAVNNPDRDHVYKTLSSLGKNIVYFPRVGNKPSPLGGNSL